MKSYHISPLRDRSGYINIFEPQFTSRNIDACPLTIMTHLTVLRIQSSGVAWGILYKTPILSTSAAAGFCFSRSCHFRRNTSSRSHRTRRASLEGSPCYRPGMHLTATCVSLLYRPCKSFLGNIRDIHIIVKSVVATLIPIANIRQ